MLTWEALLRSCFLGVALLMTPLLSHPLKDLPHRAVVGQELSRKKSKAISN